MEETGAADVVRWMLHQGRYSTRMREFGDEMCKRIVEAGIPLWRGFCALDTLHPQVAATAYVWRRGEGGAARRTAGHGLQQRPQYQASPIAAVQAAKRTLRWRLEDPACVPEYEVLAETKTDGGTDYVAMPLSFSSGQIGVITWATDRPGGFSEADIAGLTEVAEVLTLIVELQASRRIARQLMATYVGRRTAEHVLSGAIQRGSVEVVNAVIWFSDLRGFTSLADLLPRQDLIALLNDYFEVVGAAVQAEGGEILKFIGDAVLAIFEFRDASDAKSRAEAALRAARATIAAMQTRNAERHAAGKPEIRFGLALHLGEVSYGNIGAPDRLDFTVIGPAVNHANRLEKLASELGQPLLASASFAAALGSGLKPLGRHELRGVAEPQEIFAIPA